MENAYIYTCVSALIQMDGFSLEAQEANPPTAETGNI